MKAREAAQLIAKREGHKSQTRIGDIGEILGICADLTHENPEFVEMLTKLGNQRAKKKTKKVK